eukprot:jgi/Bigna1/142119/aug1.67_g16827
MEMRIFSQCDWVSILVAGASQEQEQVEKFGEMFGPRRRAKITRTMAAGSAVAVAMAVLTLLTPSSFILFKNRPRYFRNRVAGSNGAVSTISGEEVRGGPSVVFLRRLRGGLCATSVLDTEMNGRKQQLYMPQGNAAGSGNPPSDFEARLRVFEAACDQLNMGTSTEKIKEAELLLRSEIRRSGSFELILHSIVRSTNYRVRQLASILLRKVISTHWERFVQRGLGPTAPIQIIKKTLLSSVVNEEHPLVRRAHLAAVAVVTQRLVRLAQKQGEELESQTKNANDMKLAPPSEEVIIRPEAWSDVIQFMHEGLRHPVAHVRESVMILYGLLAFESAQWITETPVERRKKERQTGSLLPSLEVYLQTLQDPDEQVRKTAMKSLNAMIEAIIEYDLPEDQNQEIIKIVPLVLRNIRTAADEADEETLRAGTSLLDNLAVIEHKSIVRFFAMIVDMFAFIISSDKLDLPTRKATAESFSALLYSYSDTIVSGGHMQKIMDPLLKLACDSVADSFEESLEDNFWSLFSMITEYMPLEQGLSMLAPATSSMVAREEQNVRAAGAFIMGVLVDGLLEVKAEERKEKGVDVWQTFLPVCVRLLHEEQSSPMVIETSMRAISAMIQLVREEFPEYAFPTIARATQLLHSESPMISSRAAKLLARYVEYGPMDKVKQIVAPLMLETQGMVKQSAANNATEAVKSGLRIVSSAADRIGEEFSSLMYDWIPLIHQLTVHEPTKNEYMATGVQTMSQIAMAVGRKHFEVHLKDAMRLAELALSHEESQTQSTGIYFFACICGELLGSDTATVIPSFMPYLLGIIRTTETLDLISVRNDDVGPDLAFEEDEQDDAAEGAGDNDEHNKRKEEDGDGKKYDYSVSDRITNQQAFQANRDNIDKLSTAIVALDLVCRNAPSLLEPHVQTAIEVLLGVVPNPSPEVTAAALECQGTVFKVAQGMLESARPEDDTRDLEAFLASKSNDIMKQAMSLIEEDYNLSVLLRSLRTLEFFISHYGVTDGDMANRLFEYVDNVLHGVTYAQQQIDTDASAVSSSTSEIAKENKNVQSSAVNLLCTLVHSLEPSHAVGLLTSSVDKTMKAFFRAGILSDVLIAGMIQILQNLGKAADPLVNDKIPLIVSAMESDKFEVRRVCASFLAGLLEAHPELLITAPVDGVDRTGDILKAVVSVASAVPQGVDGPPDTNALASFQAAIVASMWIFVARHTQANQLPVDTSAAIQAHADMLLPVFLREIPLKDSSMNLNLAACRAIEKLWDLHCPAIRQQYHGEALAAVARTHQLLAQGTSEKERDILGDNIKETEKMLAKMQSQPI